MSLSLFLIGINWKLLLRPPKKSIVHGISITINESLRTFHNSLLDLYILFSFSSRDNFLLFIFNPCKSPYNVIFDWVPCTKTFSYITLYDGYCWSVERNFLLCTYDICSAYKKLISEMFSFLLAIIIMFIQIFFS